MQLVDAEIRTWKLHRVCTTSDFLGKNALVNIADDANGNMHPGV
jgi:hypothetical protein